MKTCRLKCLKIHKKELNCDGIRDKTKFKPLKQITESDLMNDYIFLEDCTHYASARRTDKIKLFTAHNNRTVATVKIAKLKKAAAEPKRQIKLELLLPNFDKRKTNTTFFDWKLKVIFWRIEWRFIDEKTIIAFDEQCNETKTMMSLISMYFENKNANEPLKRFREHGLEKLMLLLKAEGIRKCQNRFFPIDLSKTLQENLFKRTIVEFPVIYVVFNENIGKYDVISNGEDFVSLNKINYGSVMNFSLLTDEDLIAEETKMHKNIYFPMNKGRVNTSRNRNDPAASGANSQCGLTKKEKGPVNFLFANEDDADDDSNEELI